MKIADERKLLSTIRDAVLGHESCIPPFIEAMSPLFNAFIESGIEMDEYHGWCYGLVFQNATISDCEPYRSAIFSSENSWKFFPEGNDDCTYTVPGKGIIKIHLSSFLWRM